MDTREKEREGQRDRERERERKKGRERSIVDYQIHFFNTFLGMDEL